MNLLFSRESEMGVLGSMLLSPVAVDECLGILKPGDFFNEAHRIIFASMCRLHEAGQAIDPFTLQAELETRNQFADIGGHSFLLDLGCCVPSAANACFYAKAVKDKSVLRAKRAAALALIESIDDGESMDVIEAKSEMVIAASVGHVEAPIYHISSIESDGDYRGLKTTNKALNDSIWHRGFPVGQITLVQADTGGGKSTWMMTEAFNAAKRGVRVLYATFADLTARDVQYRLLRWMTGFDKPQGDEERAFWLECRESLSQWPIQVYDSAKVDGLSSTIETFAAWFKAANAKDPFDLVFLDYAQEIGTSDSKAHSLFDQAFIAANKASKLAMQHSECAFVVGSQISKDAEGNLKSRNSKRWDDVAAWRLVISRDDVEVTKGRYGGKGTKAGHSFNGQSQTYVPDEKEFAS